ncbi:hypothetical protein [Spirosoma telluris]|uniref:hypothetical protein n=1 Tax=Spirosoma telluris TaxID=2183553 RepID=UPI002FC3B562
MKRRNFLQTAALAGTIPLCGSPIAETGSVLKTPALSTEEQEAIATALGKKGIYNEAQATYNITLPRNDLKVSVKGDSVPIPFGFGDGSLLKRHWMANKRL